MPKKGVVAKNKSMKMKKNTEDTRSFTFDDKRSGGSTTLGNESGGSYPGYKNTRYKSPNNENNNTIDSSVLGYCLEMALLLVLWLNSRVQQNAYILAHFNPKLRCDTERDA